MASRNAPSKRSLQARLTGKVGPLPVWAWAALILGAYLLYTHLHPSTVATSADATPVGTGDDSAAQQPGGGAGNAAGNLNDALLAAAGVTAADPLTAQVQQSDTGSPQTPTMLTPSVSTPFVSYGGPAQTVNGTPATSAVVLAGQGYEQSAPGSDAYIPVPLSEAAPTSNIHRPGSQL